MTTRDPLAARPDLRTALIRRYATPPRAYHSWDHAVEVAARVMELGGSDACVLAAYGHDVVYEPGNAHNEDRSATWMAAHLSEHDPVAEVSRLIRLTAAHEAAEHDRDGGILCDADMAILAAAPQRYAAYVAAVRAEYGALSEQEWRSGRLQFVEGVLASESIFHTAAGRERFEQPARRNLQMEATALRGAG